MQDADREYPSIVSVSIHYLLDMHKEQYEVGDPQIERITAIQKQAHPDILNEERAHWLRSDLKYLVENFWAVLKDKKNRGRRDEIIRGALR